MTVDAASGAADSASGEAADAAASGVNADGDAEDDAALQLVLALHRLVRSLRRGPSTGLHPTQLLVLVQLVESGPLRVGELAARVPCSQPTVTTVANSLEVDGLVQRIRDTADGRAIRLRITDAGRAAVLDVVRGHASLLRQRLTDLNDADRDLVLAAAPVLQRMAQRRPLPG